MGKEFTGMGWLELVMIAIGLSMDAFAVSLCKGLSLGKVNWKHCLKAGLYFGGFQMGNAHFGLLFGQQFFLADPVGGPLDCLWTAGHHRRQHDPGKAFTTKNVPDPSMGIKAMLLLAVATSN